MPRKDKDDDGMVYSVTRLAKFVCIAALSAVVAGCISANSPKPLAFASITRPAVASSDTILGALNNGILPQSAVNGLSKPEKLRALEAEYQALEKTPLGQKVAWASPVGGASGEVTAGTPYQVGQQNCRQYTHTATIRGAPVTGQGAACRNPDGSWTPLS
jgi:surface antigen